MKIVLMSMPDVAAVIMHESAFHMPNNGIASIAANLDEGHQVTIIDLIRKRRRVRQYVTQTLLKIRPDVVGLSAMAWQYKTCTQLARLIKHLLPGVKIVIGGYHATLMYEEIAASAEASFIDFIIRGEGEEAFRRLINALGGNDRLEDIPSLSFKNGAGFIHNPRGELLDLSKLKLPIRDKRRLTWGYHIMNRQSRSDRDLPGLHPCLQLLQHESHVRPDVPPLSPGADPGRHRRYLLQAQNPLDICGRRQPRAGTGPRHGAL